METKQRIRKRGPYGKKGVKFDDKDCFSVVEVLPTKYSRFSEQETNQRDPIDINLMTSTNKPGVTSTKICDTTSGRDESEAENQAMEVDTDYDVLESVELDKITSGGNCGAADVQKLIINYKDTKKKTRIDQSEFDISNNMETLENHNDEFEDVWNEFVTEMKESLEEENPADVAVDDYDVEDADIFEEVLIDTQTKQSSSCSFESLKKTSDKNNTEEDIKVKEKKFDKEKQPLFDGSRLKMGTVMLLFCLLMTKHNLTGAAMHDIFSIVSFILPIGNILCSSFSEFKTLFSALKYPIIMHYYCNICLMPLDSKDAQICPNKKCCWQLTGKGTKSYFVEIQVVQQLQALLKRKGFYELLQHRFSRTKTNDIRDIYDGSIYKSLAENDGILSSPDNVSFLINSDGAPIFKSSKVSIWPVFLVINELPFNLRTAKENIIFAGLWFGARKPLMTTFLKPLFNSLKQLENGVEINSPDRGTFILKGALIACTCDLPARAIITNTIQYNGAFCCVKCLQRGQTAKTGEKGSTHVFSFNSDDPKGPTRTEESVLENSKDALQLRKNGSKQQHVNGIKGRSWFMSLSYFHLVDGIAIDYMHSILLGIQKKLLTLWFSPQYKSKSYNVSDNVSLIDKRLLATRPPSVINRTPRNVSDSLKYWKASEFRSFLLFYGVPLLCGILPSIYLQHYILLVHGIFILLKDNITENDLVAVESCLLEFVRKFERLYDLKFETLNFHQLVHLVDQVRKLGGLWTHACFTFEDKIRVILKFIHGSQCIDSQIVTAVSFTQKIPELIADYVNEESGAKPLKEQLTSGYLPKIQERIMDGIYRLGTMINRKIFEDEFEAVTSCLGFPPLSMNCQSFTRIIFKNKILVYGTDYHRLIRRDNSVVKIIDMSETVVFFQICRFLKVTVRDKSHFICIGNELKPVLGYSSECHITKVHKEEQMKAFRLQDIANNCAFVNVVDTGDNYVCEFPNVIEAD